MKSVFLGFVVLVLSLSNLAVALGENSETATEAVGLQAGYGKVDLGSCPYQDTCTVGYYEGACIDTSCCSGTKTSGLCPGGSNIQCCTRNKCSTPSGSGICMQTSLCKSQGGTSFSGYCYGPTEIQCCVENTPTPTPTNSVYGVDVSTAISSSAASCFASSDISFVIPRGYRSSGSVDPNVCTSIKSAASAGIKTRDTYLFPCPTCSKSASTQMGELVSYLNSNCKSQFSGRVWLDIEGSQYWLSSTSSNRAWYQELVDSCKSHGVSCGVYSSASQWSAIFGSTSYAYGSNLPLWYAHYDGKASFSDFSSFGGWTSPHAKQYQGDVTLCSMGVDKNYSPNF